MVCEMAEKAMDALRLSCGLMTDFDPKTVERIRKLEEEVDEYEDRLGSYLVRISEVGLGEKDAKQVNLLLHMLGDLERISDHAVNLAESAEEIHEKQLVFSAEATDEIGVLRDAVLEIIHLSHACVTERSMETAELVEPLEQVIDGLRDEIKRRHILRLGRGTCSMEQGFVLGDILTDLERVADHCSNLGGCLLELSREGDLRMHRYLKEYRRDSEEFELRRRRFFEKYHLNDEKS
jgi:phosphate:Na+ symporter